MKLLKRLSQYKVRKGDTLSKIAKDNDLDLIELLEANKDIENPDVIFADTTVNIPKKEQYITDEMTGTGIRPRDQIAFEVRKNLYNRGLDMSDDAQEFLDMGPMTGTSIPAKDIIRYDLKRLGNKIKKEMGELFMSPQRRFDEKLEERQKERPDFINYTVKKGDTISSIAKRNKLNIDQLYLANAETLDSPDKIQIGQTLRVPQFGIYQQQDFQERTNLPAEKPKERFLPSNVRQLLSDINPVNRIKRNLNIGMEDFTEADLRPAELEAARDIARKVIAGGGTTISYEDFETSEGAYDDVGGKATGVESAIRKFNDPNFALKTLIGQANITQNDRGEIIIVDRYNFNEEDPNSFKDYAQKLSRVVSDPIYGTFREAGSIFGSNEGEGSFIRLNLGRL